MRFLFLCCVLLLGYLIGRKMPTDPMSNFVQDCEHKITNLKVVLR